jgi:hypothetical protein
MMAQQGRRRAPACWWRSFAACAITLTLGLDPACAEIENAHEGGQGRDKETSAVARELGSGGEAGARAFATARTAPPDIAVDEAPEPGPVFQVADEVDGTDPTTRSSTRTFVKDGFVVSRTRSTSVAFDEGGNRVVARAVAKTRVPDDVAAVESGAGRVVAKASVAVAGEGAGTTDTGGSIGVSGGRVAVATWGRTSAEIF